jgi:beta-lactamase superfamily II metal-dependent hydrolase
MKKHILPILVLCLFVSIGLAFADGFEPSGKLEVHYINVGQGGCTMIIGPDGTRILYDFGNVSGKRHIIPYLQKAVGLMPEDGFDYSIVSHRDKDHYVGYKALVDKGYDFKVANYGCGSPKEATPLINRSWLNPAQKTTGKAVQTIPVGMRFPLGDGAEALVAASNGNIYKVAERRPVTDENDRSIALYITYKDFQYILDGDLGSGPEECTHHDTRQIDVQTHVARALIDQGLMDEVFGVDVLHIAHHGSESSTSAAYYNLVRPEVGLISVGLKQGTFRHPREDVVDLVLLETPGKKRPDCVKAPPLKALFQTERGAGYQDPDPGQMDRCSSTGCTSFSGQVVGSIKLVTDGKEYEIYKFPSTEEETETKQYEKIWSAKVDEAIDQPIQ